MYRGPQPQWPEVVDEAGEVLLEEGRLTDRSQVHGYCSIDQGRPTETKFGLSSVPFLNLLNKIVIQVGNFE